MKTLRFAAFVAAGSLLIYITASAQAQKAAPQTATIRRQIEGRMHAMDAATSRKDLQASLRFYSDDFQGQDIDGSVWNKKQTKESTIKSYNTAKTIRSQAKLNSIRIENGNAVVVSQEHTAVEVVGKRTGKTHTVVFDGTWRSIWTKRSGAWQIWREKHLTQKMTRDGVVVPPKQKAKP